MKTEAFDFDKVHFNTGLLVKELQKRWIKVSMMEETDLIIAEYKWHIEIIQDTNVSSMPYTIKYALDDKYLTKRLLQKIWISVPEGERFYKDELYEAKQYAEYLGYPVVVKPTIWSHGENVYVNINNSDELEKAFYSIYSSIWGDNWIKVLVENQFEWNEHRVFMTKDGFVAAVEREPANVIGDGNSTLQQLIDKENYRRMNPRDTCLCEIWLDDISEKFFRDRNLSLDYVAKQWEKVYIRPNSNVSGGANCRDITDTLHPSVIEIGQKILNSLTGLPFIGIDFMCKDITKPQKGDSYIICELNTTPGLSLHSHEETGRVRNVAGAVVDTIFPETK